MICKWFNSLIFKNFDIFKLTFQREKMSMANFNNHNNVDYNVEQNGENGFQKKIIDQMKGLQLDEQVSLIGFY